MRRGIMGLLVTTLAALATGGAAPVVDVAWLRSHAGDASPVVVKISVKLPK